MRFFCATCGMLEEAAPVMLPVCHGAPMRIFDLSAPDLEIKWADYDLSVCDPHRAPESVFTFPPDSDPKAQWELWLLPPHSGRYQGERMGWVWRTALGYGFQAVPGCRSVWSNGFAATRVDAAGKLLEAIRDG